MTLWNIFLVAILKKTVKSESNDGRYFRIFSGDTWLLCCYHWFFFFEWSKVLGNNCDVILFLTQYLNRFDLYLRWMLAHLWASSWVACSCIAVSFLRSVAMAWNVITERYNNQFKFVTNVPKLNDLKVRPEYGRFTACFFFFFQCLFLFYFF